MDLTLAKSTQQAAMLDRAVELLASHRGQIYRRTDRLFGALLFAQWLAGIAVALWVSPRTWTGGSSQIHVHVWTAIFLGGAIALPPILLVIWRPGETLTRYVIAVAQSLASALLIHLSGGRIETHFHIFGSLAFLAFYRDWKVLAIASLIASVDHLLRGIFWPQSVFGNLVVDNWRWVEHVGWVVFEDIFLTYSCLLGQAEMREIALRRAELEVTRDAIEQIVDERTTELASTNRELEQQVERRRQIEIELVSAKDAAEAASLAKSEFLANMSHEIRTPMNGVLGMTSLLMETHLDEQQQGFAETIRQSGDSLLTIINEILDFSKIEAGHIELEYAPVTLLSCVEEAIDLFARVAAEKRIDLISLIDDDAPACFLGDVTRVRQVLVNLIGNAMKFTTRGEVFVEVTSVRIPPPADAAIRMQDQPQVTLVGESPWHEIRFTIRDTGVGIPADRMNRLFKLFSQVDASMTRRFGGTGLGLAISKQLTELMGGEIGVESETGKGSTFFFSIVVPETDTPPEDLPPVIDPSSFEGRQLLVVDDNATNRRILCLQGQRWGMVTHEASSGAEALEFLNTRPRPDVAILDMQMPEMDGLELAEKIHADPRLCSLPLIMLSSAGMMMPADDIRRQSFVSWFTKPVRKAQLCQALSRALQPTPAGGAMAYRPAVPAAQENQMLLADEYPMSILLAEDNLVNQKVARLLLARLGYEVDVAADGLEVIEAVHRRKYHAILMDVQMPNMDGLEATRRIRAEFPDSNLQIIALTAHARESDHRACLAAGMDDYLPKPLRPVQLEQKLRLAGARMRQSAV
jgi:signal transduction histidine kinase/CheY-like chemotaxis protein